MTGKNKVFFAQFQQSAVTISAVAVSAVGAADASASPKIFFGQNFS